MLVALVSLLIIMLATLAMVRSVDTGTQVVGNLGFKQDATEVAGVGAEQALAWLSNKTANSGGDLNADIPAEGYYASSVDTLDPTGANTTAALPLRLIDWDADGCGAVAAGTFFDCTITPKGNNPTITINGNRVAWVITRLCEKAAPPDVTNRCNQPIVVSTTTASDRGSLESGGRISASVSGPYYRVIVRAVGPRNSVSFTETIAHF
ncbi:MAG: pilus assembly PilX family protein [Rhodoferax sp.]